MKYSILSLLLIFCFTVKLYSIDPPLKLKWGMTYEEVKSHLEEKDIDLDDLEESEGLLEGFTKADLGDIEVRGKDTDWPFLVFDANEKLAAVAYNFEFLISLGMDGKAEAWKFLQDLKEIFNGKYGEPASDGTQGKMGDDIGEDLILTVRWYTEKTNEEIDLEITYRKNIAVSKYYINLYYLSDTFLKAQKKAMGDTEEL